MKKKTWILASSLGLVLVVVSVVATLLLTPVLTTKARGTATNGVDASGTFVIAWNKELLKIVKTPGAQPATIHPTRSYAILHAAIYDAVVSITGDAPAYLFSVAAPSGARADAAAAQAGHDALVAQGNSRASRSDRPSPHVCSLRALLTVPLTRHRLSCRATISLHRQSSRHPCSPPGGTSLPLC